MYATITHFNAIDLFMVATMAMIIRTGWRRGIISEFVKLTGTFCTIFITLHYYVRFADFLRYQFFGRDATTEFFAFSILAVLFFAVFVLISHGWVLILKLRAHPAVDHYGGAFFAFVRSYFTCGLIFFALILIGHESATPAAKRSISRSVYRYVATDFYKASYSAVIENVFSFEKRNNKAVKLMEGTSKRGRKK